MKFSTVFLAACSLRRASSYLVAPPGTPAPGAADNCSKWIQQSYGLSCAIIERIYGMTEAQLVAWNPSAGQMGSKCNLIQGLYYCVEVDFHPLTSSSSSQETPTSTTTITTSTSTNGISTPTPTQPGMVGNCNKFYLVKKGDNCAAIAAANAISLQDFSTWNPQVENQCSGLWADAYACVGIIGSQPGTPTDPSNGIQTPSPTQPDIVKVCSQFHLVQPGQSCGDVAAKNGITVSDLIAWNPKAGSNCAGMWANAWACVGIIKHYNFADRTNDRWTTVDGTWSESSGVLVVSGSGMIFLDVSFTNFILEADVTLSSSSGNAGVIFRSSNVANGPDSYQGYYAGISTEGGGSLVLGRSNNDWNEVRHTGLNIQSNQAYRIRVQALANDLSIFVNDMITPKIFVQDDVFHAGAIGARTYTTGASFDNVDISPVIYDNFDQNMVGWTIYDGGFDARTHQLVASETFSGKTTLDTIFQDFTLEADITLPTNTDGNAGFMFRVSGVSNGPDAYHGYYVGFGTNNAITLGRADGSWHEITHSNVQIRNSQPYRLKVSVVSSTISVFVDDLANPKFTVQDSSYSSGMTGIRVFRTGAIVDNYRIQKM